MEELSPLRGGLEELEEDILAYKENLSKLKSLGGAVVLKWGTKDRQEMQETRNNMQTENRKLEEDIRKKIDTLWNHNEGLGNDAAAFMRTALLEARQIEIDYIQKVQEQLIKLLKSLGVITTREYVEAVEDIGMLKPENVEDKDWNQVEERRQELGSLDKTLIILGETLISLERGNPKSKVEELDKKSETDLWTSKLKVAESVVETFLDSTLAKHLQGRRFKIIGCCLAAVILILLVVVIYGIVKSTSSTTTTTTTLLTTTTPTSTTTTLCIPSSPSDICSAVP